MAPAKSNNNRPKPSAVLKQLFNQKGVDAFKQVKGIVLNFAEKYSRERVENACTRALYYKTATYMSIKSILKKELDKEPLNKPDYAIEGQTDFRFARNPDYFKV